MFTVPAKQLQHEGNQSVVHLFTAKCCLKTQGTIDARIASGLNSLATSIAYVFKFNKQHFLRARLAA
jgi:hypothetical protein